MYHTAERRQAQAARACRQELQAVSHRPDQASGKAQSRAAQLALAFGNPEAAGLAETAYAHREFRQLQRVGNRCSGLMRCLHCGQTRQETVPQIQHQNSGRCRRLCLNARGSDSTLPTRDRRAARGSRPHHCRRWGRADGRNSRSPHRPRIAIRSNPHARRD